MLKFDTDTHKLYSDNENCLVYNEEMKVFPTDFVYLPFYVNSLIYAENIGWDEITKEEAEIKYPKLEEEEE